jgi:hypothetical protein
MQRQFAFTLLLLIAANVSAQNKDIQELTKLNQDWLHTYITKDSATFDKIFADDFILISPIGTKISKTGMINNLPNQETVSINIDSVDVRLLTENAGIITAYINFVLKVDGKDVSGRNCYQDVYVKRKNKWQAVSAHVTLLNMK